jgi:hypothetical protein
MPNEDIETGIKELWADMEASLVVHKGGTS